ncbi:single-stranded DNA-binding protein [Brachybacterium sp. YJGR34]|uniref:single-stranded DNA-binding protein n=1 Tax=Brachybacterium sp. YJGR34 TaxID=2059911 RepID=UPI0013008B1E|nr:single-stranded DNA-binding protein [Brachybacterium sp. YJGR34]
MREIRTTIRGNATGDPSDRTREDGRPSAYVRIAVTPTYYNASTEDYADRKTEFISIYARGRLSRNLLESVRKGQPLIVTGRLSSSEWIGDDGTQRHSLNVQADAIGHDLSFGKATFTKPLKEKDFPDLDPQTDDVMVEHAVDEESGEIVGDARADDSLEPAF